jgi:hypothetical protein
MRALLNLRYTVPERRAAFENGLKRIGDPEVFLTWNRIGSADRTAKEYEARGLPVIVAENAAWGNEFQGRRWYSMARTYHNTAGMFQVGDANRWDSLDFELFPWKTTGETVVLPQRGIGPPGVAMPRDWPARQVGRIRSHPGTRPCKPLEEDLAKAGKVVTWGSGAAIKALMWGIPVEAHMPNWIGEQNNTNEGRLAMFRSLAWAQWDLAEIASGEAFEWLLRSPA